VLVIYFKFFESFLGVENRESPFESRHRPRNEDEIIGRLSASSGFGEDEEALIVCRIEKEGSLPCERCPSRIIDVSSATGNISKCLRPELTIPRK